MIHDNSAAFNWPQIVALHFETSVIPLLITNNTFLQRWHLFLEMLLGPTRLHWDVWRNSKSDFACGCFEDHIPPCAGPRHAQCGRPSNAFSISRGGHGKQAIGFENYILKYHLTSVGENIFFFCKDFLLTHNVSVQ